MLLEELTPGAFFSPSWQVKPDSLKEKKWPQIQNRTVILVLSILYHVCFILRQQTGPTSNVIKIFSMRCLIFFFFFLFRQLFTHTQRERERDCRAMHMVKTKLFIQEGQADLLEFVRHIPQSKRSHSHLSRIRLRLQQRRRISWRLNFLRPLGQGERKIGRVLQGGGGTVPAWRGRNPATSLPTSSIFRDSLVSAWAVAWPRSSQGEGTSCIMGVSGGEKGATRNHATEWWKAMLPVFCFLVQVTLPFKMTWGGVHNPVSRVWHSSSGSEEHRRKLYTLSLLDQLGSNLNSGTSQFYNLGRVIESLCASISLSISWDR